MSEPVKLFQQTRKTLKNRKLYVSLYTSCCMAETYKTYSTLIAPNQSNGKLYVMKMAF